MLARLGRAAGPGRPARPRPVLAADRRPRRGFAYASSAAGHADGRPPGADGGRGAQHLPRGRAGPHPAAPTARSGSPTGSPGGSSPSASGEPFTTSARLVAGARPTPSRRLSGAAGGHPAKRTFQALRIEVNGELGRPGVGAARARSPRWPSAAGSPCWRTTRWRTGWSSRCWPPGLGDRPPAACRWCPTELGPRAAAADPGRRRPPRPRWRPTRGPPRPGCGPPSGSRTDRRMTARRR